MMILYKLTNQDNTTHNGFKWEVGNTYKIPQKERKMEMCNGGMFHAYRSIELGLLLNPIHAKISNPKLFEMKGKIQVEDFGKVGTYSLSCIKEIKLPKWYVDESVLRKVQIQFAILCAEKVLHYYTKKYPNDDRPQKAIDAAKECLKTGYAAYAAYDAAAAAYAAYAAYDDAAAAAAADAAHAAVFAAAAADAAHAAVFAADAAAYDVKKIDFNEIAKQAVSMQSKDGKSGVYSRE